MLTRTPSAQSAVADLPPDAATISGASELSPLQVVLRRKWAILLFAVLFTCAGFLVLKQLAVRYSADASVMVDARKLQVIDAQSVLSSPTLDLDRLRTYMEQLRSPSIAEAVVAQLGLTHDPAFCPKGPGGGWLGLFSTRAAAPNDTCDTTVEDAAQRLLQMVGGTNDGRSYIIKVTAEAGDPKLAAAIANAYAEAYVAAQRAQTSDATAQADGWLTSYLAQLRAQMLDADAAVEQYQRANQLTPLRGETVVSQRLAELNSQLTLATSALAERQSALQQVQTLSKTGTGRVDASAPAVLASPVIQTLVEKQSELQERLADLHTHYGDSYPAVQAAEAQAGRLRQAIGAEVAKVISSLSDEVSALEARKASLAATVQDLQSATGTQAGAGVRLAELQRDADTDHRLYETMVTRLHEVQAESHLQWPSSTVVVAARPPQFPSFPRVKMMLAGIFMVALGIGAVVAFALSLLSATFRDIDQVEMQTGARVLGLFPQPPRRTSASRMVIDQPASLEAETLNFVLVNLGAAANRPEGRVVMVASALPKEGRSSFALALGQCAVRAGLSVALLNADKRSAQPIPLIAGPGAGHTPCTLPVESCGPDSDRLPTLSVTAALLRRLRAEHDLVLVDTPPILSVPDASSLASLVDEAIMLVDWHGTARHSAVSAIRVLQRCGVDLSGIVLSKVSLRELGRQGTGEGFYARRYSGFGRRVRA